MKRPSMDCTKSWTIRSTVLFCWCLRILDVIQLFMSWRQLMSDYFLYFLVLLWKTKKKNRGAVRKTGSQADRLSREQRPLRRCVTQVLNKATCQTDVCKEKKKKNTLKSPQLDGTHILRRTRTNFSFFFKARLDMIERQSCCISP